MRDPQRIDFEPNLLLDLEDVPGRCCDAQRRAAGAGRHQVVPVLAEIGALDDAALDPPAAAITLRAPEPNALRSDREKHAPAELGKFGKAVGAEREAGEADLAVGERALEEIRAADEAGDEARPGPVVEGKGIGDL